MDASNARISAERTAGKAADHPALLMLARGGYVVSGVLHLIIGWIAVQIATGTSGGEASNSGALTAIAAAPGGQVLLWASVAALAALGLWRLLGILIHDEAKDKAKAAVLGIVYLWLSVTAATFARGSSSSDEEKATDVTASVLAQPWGMALVTLAGLVVLAAGLYSIVKGATRRFREDLEAGAEAGDVGTAIIAAGTAGYIARGIAFSILGGMIVWAAWSNDPEKAGGLDTTLRTIGQQPAGMVLLIAVGVGLGLYGLYSIARARYVTR